MAWGKHCVLTTLANYILFVLVFSGSAILYFIGEPFKQGFFCSDESIRYPYKTSTVSNIVLYLVSFFMPLVILAIGDIVTVLLEIRRNELDLQPKVSKLKVIVEQISCTMAVFLFGFASTQFSVDIMKYSVGRLRPHFLAVCQPEKFNCTGQYIEDFVCTSGTQEELKQARLSFPSGHAALSIYAMLFLICYIHEKFHFQTLPLLKTFLQIPCFYMAIYASVSRVFDYWHHPTDVLAGFLLGAFMAIVTAKLVANNFKLSWHSQDRELLPTDKTI
ncbi:hypothetical protein LOTGIDRAFT_237348 [Lottia gigantea]|uniref:Phosphatidic acid phosphatase type 2/haloperoxidase domain-containing protein n=1 Tax=Lottia gigantea TaxID=225164 RepID=V4BFA0_LOTGI|nr:hypothetical protein LOTGIDRAFT_237348 [Lottia gigantea]ESP04507.1 hypothetical protein LOTGIDRAFT_237348 [Lottia gigantea]